MTFAGKVTIVIPTSKEKFKAILDRQQQSGLSIRDFCSNEAYTVYSGPTSTTNSGANGTSIPDETEPLILI